MDVPFKVLEHAYGFDNGKQTKEETKSGFFIEDLFKTLPELACLKNLNIIGLMTIGANTDDEKSITISVIVESQFYVTAAQGAANCGADPSTWIDKLEKLLGCICTCNCNEGTPIIDNTPAKDFNITGCNVNKETVGLTDNYTINLYDYSLTLDDTSGILSLGAIVQDGCNKTQHLNINPKALVAAGGVDFIYRGKLSQSGSGNPTAVVDTRNTVTIAWVTAGVGVYVGTLSGTFTPLTQNNTFILMGKPSTAVIRANFTSANTITVESLDPTTLLLGNSLMTNLPFELSIMKQ